MFKIQLLDNIAVQGINQFDTKRYEVGRNINNPDAILVRSSSLHAFDFPPSIKIVGRAGVGVNNIPVSTLTERGIPVVNTPGGNANAVKELVIAGMFLASRNLFQAIQYTHELASHANISERAEADKKRFVGTEIQGRTLGIIGLGNVGVKVANAALALGMKVIGYDPSISVKRALELSPQVEHTEVLAELLGQADFITLHVPLMENTQHLINKERIKLMKMDAVLLNFARDEIVDPDAILMALSTKKLKVYVSDFPAPMLLGHPQVINLPHIGASTLEAETNCAVMVANQIQDFLEQGTIVNSVNFPNAHLARPQGYRLAIVNINAPSMVAQISQKIGQARLNINEMLNKSHEKIAYTILDIDSPVDETVLAQIAAITGVINVRVIEEIKNTNS